MALTYGTEGIKQKDYRVYLAPAVAGVTSAIATYVAPGGSTKTNAEAVIAAMTAAMVTQCGATSVSEIGECRADSITVTGENGDTIEGNVLGEIVLNKACAAAAELINATAANINGLASLDGVPVSLMLLEKDRHLVGNNLSKTSIVINNIVMSYSENITGGDSIRAMFNISKSVPSITDFRHVADVTWAL
jgi:hypothetical protein